MAIARRTGKEEAAKAFFEKLTEAENENESLKEVLQKYEDEKLSAEERVQKEFERKMGKVENEKLAEQEEKSKYLTLYNKERINNTLYKELSKFDIYNLKQAMDLLQKEGQASLVESNGKDEVVLKFEVDGEIIDMAAEEAVKHWIKQSHNQHHLKANLISGAGTNRTLYNSNGAKVISKEEWQKKLSSATAEERKELMQECTAGKIVVNTDN